VRPPVDVLVIGGGITGAGVALDAAGNLYVSNFFGGNSVFGAMGGSGTLMAKLAKALGKADDPIIRQDLMQLYSYHEVSRFMALRQKAMRAPGQDVPGVAQCPDHCGGVAF